MTEGLDGLRDRLAEYSRMGLRFAKWRAVIAVGEGIPSRGCIEANAQALARYAALCQEAGLVPAVEPEVLMAGEHTLERCCEVTAEVLRTVFDQLYTQRVTFEGMILKPNMLLPGLTCPEQKAVNEVADATVGCLLRVVPAAVPGIAFLSGGQSGELASARLNAMNVRFKSRLPWALTFSFARAIQQPALEIWQGREAQVMAAQQALYHRASCDRAARRGQYSAAMDKDMQHDDKYTATHETCGIATIAPIPASSVSPQKTDDRQTQAESGLLSGIRRVACLWPFGRAGVLENGSMRRVGDHAGDRRVRDSYAKDQDNRLHFAGILPTCDCRARHRW